MRASSGSTACPSMRRPAAGGRSWWPTFKLRGAPCRSKDSLIAATALVHGLTVVTRNRAGFANAGVKIADPFAE